MRKNILEVKKLSRREVAWMSRCGLPEIFALQRIVLNYAEGLSNEEEYLEFYENWPLDLQEIANEMITKISLANEKIVP